MHVYIIFKENYIKYAFVISLCLQMGCVYTKYNLRPELTNGKGLNRPIYKVRIDQLMEKGRIDQGKRSELTNRKGPNGPKIVFF